jgi:outer membrane protein assembly factor BamD (BamD/ComL family)
MLDYDEAPKPNKINRARLVATLLEVAGVVLALGATLWAVARFWELGQAGDPIAPPSTQPAAGALNAPYGVMDFISVVAVLTAGWAGGVMFWGLAELVRRLEALPGLIVARRGGVTWPAPATASAAPDEHHLEGMTALLRELRDISLLDDAQRAKRLEAQGRALAADLEREVPALLREHRWREARRRVQDARERFPTLAQFEALERQIETMRAQVEAHDIESAERQINDLAALHAWERAADVVRELLARHPDSQKANALAARVRQQYDKTQAEQRTRLMAQAQDAVRARDWSTALAAANTIIQRYPRSPEAEALRLQLPTLQENVEIQTRQRAEARIRELVKQGRFDVALHSAHELIDRYPNSPQAEALRGQLAKLHQRAIAMGPR